MLGKLLKYEYKATAIKIVPLFVAFLAVSVVFRFFMAFNPDFLVFDILASLIVLLFYVLFFLTIAYPYIYGIQRFNRNLLKDEGYLMNTLPVKARSLIISKIIVILTWVIISLGVALSSFFILLLGQVNESAKEAISGIKELLVLICDGFVKETGFAILITLLIIIIFASSLLMIYASICIGHLANSKRGLKAIGTFVGLSFGMQIISVSFFRFLGNTVQLNLTEEQALYFVIWMFILVSVIFASVFYFITNKVLSKHLNLE